MKMQQLDRTVIKFYEGMRFVTKQSGLHFLDILTIPMGTWSSYGIFRNEVTLAPGVSFNDQDFVDGKVAIVDGRPGHPTALCLIDPKWIESITVKKITIFVD